MATTRRNRWWIPGEGIARVVISADIQRYLGPDAVVKPGDGIENNEGVPGYWITAPRTLTSEMIQDLKQDTQRWEMEQRDAGRRGSPNVREGKSSRHPDFSLGEQQTAPSSYEASATYRSRQYYGPSETQHSPHQAPSAQPTTRERQSYSEQQTSPHYTASPYASSSNPSPYAHPGYHNHNSVPRTNPTYGSQYGQPPQNQRSDYPGYPAHPTHPTHQAHPTHPTHSAHPAQQQYSYAQPAQNPYGSAQPQYSYGQQQRPPASAPPPSRRVARPGYYIASDGNEYQIPSTGLPQ